jgi:beta-glucosidase-like glycosyl hydrolase
MTSYNSPVDMPVVISRKWSRRWLRGDAAFAGVLVTDYLEVYNQVAWHCTAADRHEAVVQALQRCSMDLVRPLHSLSALILSCL